MLKIDCITLAENNFDVVELGHLEGKAVISFGSGENVHEPAVGRFHMSNGGMRTMCTIEAATVSLGKGLGGMVPEAIVLKKPSDLTVALTADVVRDFALPAGESVIDLKCKDLTGVTVLRGDTAMTVASGKVTLDPVEKDRVITLTLKNLPVGTAAATAPNANHKIAITPDNPEGLLHFMILCNTPDVDGRKANKTTFEVRGAKPWKVMGERQCVAFLAPPDPNDPEVTESAGSETDPEEP